MGLATQPQSSNTTAMRPSNASDDDDVLAAGVGDAFEDEEPQMDTSMKQVRQRNTPAFPHS